MANDLQPWYDFLSPAPNTTYGSILPFAVDEQTQTPRFAMPESVRSGLKGILDLANSTQTGGLTGDALSSLAMGIGGAGLSAPRGAVMGAGPIRAYHGSPHDFDRFDISKIGTGEGAQAYGHGLYFAENEGVGQSYKTAGMHSIPVSYEGQSFTTNDMRGRLLDDMKLIGKDAAIQKIRDNIRFNETYAPDMARLYKNDLEWALGVDPSKINVNRGHMYEVDIHADPARFLDWDKPLSQQSPEVYDQVNRALRYKIDSVKDDMRGSELYNRAASLVNPKMDPLGVVGIDKPSATQMLREQGIPGIRYLDQGSRSAGDGSRNTVVFNPDIIEILRKYGMAVPSPVAPGLNVQPPPAPGFRVYQPEQVY